MITNDSIEKLNVLVDAKTPINNEALTTSGKRLIMTESPTLRYNKKLKEMELVLVLAVESFNLTVKN